MSRVWRLSTRQRRDIATAVVFGALWFGAIEVASRNGWYPSSRLSYVVAGMFTCVVLSTRARAPRATFLTVILLYPTLYPLGRIVTEFHLLPVMLAAYTVAETRRLRTLWTLVLALAAVTLLYLRFQLWTMLVDEMRLDWLWQWNLSQVLLAQAATGAVVLLGTAANRQRRSADELRRRNEELDRLRRLEAEQVVASERARIARELHDVVAHHISAVVIRAQAADRVGDVRPQEPRAAVRWIAASGQETLAAMRHVVRVLRSDGPGGTLAPQASLDDVPAIAERMAAVGLPVEVTMPPERPALSAAVELAAVRIIQEALTNVLVHARATRAVVSVRHEHGALHVEVEDDGNAASAPTQPIRAGVQPQPQPARSSGGHGLIGMRERAAACGGSLTVGASQLGGWRVAAWLRADPLIPEPPAIPAVAPSHRTAS